MVLLMNRSALLPTGKKKVFVFFFLLIVYCAGNLVGSCCFHILEENVHLLSSGKRIFNS